MPNKALMRFHGRQPTRFMGWGGRTNSLGAVAGTFGTVRAVSTEPVPQRQVDGVAGRRFRMERTRFEDSSKGRKKKSTARRQKKLPLLGKVFQRLAKLVAFPARPVEVEIQTLGLEMLAVNGLLSQLEEPAL